MKKFLILLFLINLIISPAHAFKSCRYDYNGNKVCRTILPEEIRAAKNFRRVEMYDSKGRKVSLYLKTYKKTIRIINSHKCYIGTGFQDRRGNIHIVENRKIVKSFYTKKYRV